MTSTATSRISQYGRRRVVTLALAAALMAAGLLFATGVEAKKPDCRAVIAGTYLIPAGSIVTLGSDGSITGSLSATSQVGAGAGDTFLGNWRCDGTSMTGRDFRWVDDPAGGQISRVDWAGTFSSEDGGTLSVTYTFYRVPEGSTAAQVLDATPLFTQVQVHARIAKP